MSASTPSARGNIDGAYRRDHNQAVWRLPAQPRTRRAGRKQNVKLKIEKSTFYMFSCLLLSFVAYRQFSILATKSRRGRRCGVDVLLSSPVLCGLSSILNCIIQDRSCLEEAAEELTGEAKMFVPGECPVRVVAALTAPKAF